MFAAFRRIDDLSVALTDRPLCVDEPLLRQSRIEEFRVSARRDEKSDLGRQRKPFALYT